MENTSVKIIAVRNVTHNVRSFTVEKPAGFTYQPGQATELSVLKPGWEKEKRPFTFTSLPNGDHLEFTIKCYTDHDGVTNQLSKAQAGDMLEISDAWGAIEYKGEGVFIAGGAGVTPFIAILRYLHAENKIGNNQLFFSNRTLKDIILKEEFEKMLGINFINIITEENSEAYMHGRIDKTFLHQNITNFNQPFYVCGPDAFTADILNALKESGAHPDSLVFEK
ncbi:flavodoxin reductase [Panacibacter ginsenosidivorans]|uniref:Flavodoxin reductase n=1 Tax=Panacibacter ginsenosidivorans TaxID=1813871 RepID=A0A5B8VE76_9BACT|nr:FAD-binding oxidoreductase [Panacibacter ginsenosidivorans]QEC69817.1 flavodoxin reductase [Panacibacter ginsenosidivorans]